MKRKIVESHEFRSIAIEEAIDMVKEDTLQAIK